MGNQQSGQAFATPVAKLDFSQYVQSSWRSQRTNELDALGGLARPPSALGQSFNAKMQYLGEQLLEQGDKMQDMLAPSVPSPAKEPVKRQPSVTGPRNTYMRAAERRGERVASMETVEQAGAPVAAANRFLTQAEYQKLRKAQVAAEKQKEKAREKPPAKPAEWRRRVHSSRRNALLMVRTMLLLKRGHKHPKRMLRFADLSFYIPQLLAEDCDRFASEQQRHCGIRASIAAARAELDELLRSSATAPPAGAPAPPEADTPPAAPADAAVRVSNVHNMLQPSLSDGPVALSPLRKISVLDSDAAVAAGGALVSSISEVPGSQQEDQHRRVTFDGGRQGPVGEPLAAPLSADSQLEGSGRSGGGSRAAGTKENRSRSVERDRVSSGYGDSSPVALLTQQRSIGGALPAQWRPERPGLSDVIEEESSRAQSNASSPLKLPSVVSPPRRTSNPNARERDRLSGGGAANTPSRKPWAPSTRSNSMQHRTLGPAISDHDGLPSTSQPPKPGRINRISSMPVTRGYEPPLQGTALPDIHAGREMTASSAPRGHPPRPSLPQPLPPAQSLQHSSQGEGHSLVSVDSQPQENRPGSRYGRMAQIRVELDKQYDLLKKSGKLMGMYINRVNGAWAEVQQFNGPVVTSSADLAQWVKGDQYNIYKADVIRQLRLGQIAVQLLVGEDDLNIPARGKGAAGAGNKGSEGPSVASKHDLWTSDLWDLIERARPGIMPATARIGGLTLCGRALCQLVLSAQSLAGPDALERLHVILHVNEEQEEEVLEELHLHQCYGLVRSNVLVVVGQRHPGYRWDPEEKTFLPESSLTASWTAGASLAATASGQHPGLSGLGSGAAACQLAWAGEAFTVGEDGTAVPLAVPILERFESKKIDWIISRRARDLGLLTRDGIFDMSQLAHAMHLRDKSRASCVIEALHADSAVIARLYDSVLLHAAGKAGGDTRGLVCELRQSELVAGPLISFVEGLRTQAGGRGLTLGMSRYLIHVPTLKGQLTSLSIFRPRLSLNRHLLHVSLDVADLWAHEKGRALAVEARSAPGVLSTLPSLESLVPLLQAQDHDPAFRDLVLKMVPQHVARHHHHEGPTVVAGNKAAQKPGHPIIVFLVNNAVAQGAVNAAANLARAGRDTIHLVTIVNSDLQKSSAEEMLLGYKRSAMRSMAEVSTHVVVRKLMGLLECMEIFVSDFSSDPNTRPLVVMGSVQLTSSVFSYMTSSVALSAVKRLAGTPVVVVTLNSKHVGVRPGMRMMALVEPHAKNMITYLCKQVIEHSRGDRLLLSQVAPSPHVTRQQAAATRRLVENFHTLAFSHQIPIHKEVNGEGPLESVVCSQVEEHGVGMVAVQLPVGTKSIPTHLINMMRSCRGATMIYQDNHNRQSVLRKSMTLRKSIGLLTTLQQARRALAIGEAIASDSNQ